MFQFLMIILFYLIVLFLIIHKLIEFSIEAKKKGKTLYAQRILIAA